MSNQLSESYAWQPNAEAYPLRGSTGDKLRFLLRYAVLAPSGHNTQPWTFEIRDDSIHLRADRRRSLPVVDPHDRELHISCGAALHHVQLAIRYLDGGEETRLLPDPGDADLLAVVRITDESGTEPDQEPMFSALTRRRSNRMAYEAKPVPPELLKRLSAAAQRYGAWLSLLVTEEQRRKLIDLIERGDLAQMADPRFRRELAAWMRPNRSSARDGIPGYALGLPLVASYLSPLLVRWFDVGKRQARKDSRLAEGSPILAVLGSVADSPSSWLATGQALSAVLLTARSEEVWAAFMNQPVEVDHLRPELAALAGEGGSPQLVLRMGYAPDVAPTPRRDISEVLAD
jgi:Nitroreductase family